MPDPVYVDPYDVSEGTSLYRQAFYDIVKGADPAKTVENLVSVGVEPNKAASAVQLAQSQAVREANEKRMMG